MTELPASKPLAGIRLIDLTHMVAVFEEWAGMSKERIDQGIAASALQQAENP